MQGDVANTTLTPRIVEIRGRRVIVDRDLADIYGVTTKRLNEQVRRNPKRFPADFMFQVTEDEAEFLRSQIATSKSREPGASDPRGGARYRPFVFTEHGAIQASNVLNSQRAIEMGLHVVRAFVKLRELTTTNEEFARRLRALENRLEGGLSAHDDAIAQILKTIHLLIREEEAPHRGIGFTADLCNPG